MIKFRTNQEWEFVILDITLKDNENNKIFITEKILNYLKPYEKKGYDIDIIESETIFSNYNNNNSVIYFKFLIKYAYVKEKKEEVQKIKINE